MGLGVMFNSVAWGGEAWSFGVIMGIFEGFWGGAGLGLLGCFCDMVAWGGEAVESGLGAVCGGARLGLGWMGGGLGWLEYGGAGDWNIVLARKPPVEGGKMRGAHGGGGGFW